MNNPSDLATLIILLTSLVLVISYVTDVYSRFLKIPTVLVLLGFGSLVHYGLLHMGVEVPLVQTFLPLLGTLGLILIVLDAALYLKADPQIYRLAAKAILSAFAALLLNSVGIMLLIHYLTGADWHASLANAIPFAVISSAMAIPSVKHLAQTKREFVVYESTFSDIFGILAFTMVTQLGVSASVLVAQSVGSALLTLVLSILLSVLLVWLVARLKHQVKFFLVLSLLLLAYGLAKLIHLPALLLVFFFGFVMANSELLTLWKPLREFISLRKMQVELRYTRLAAGELTFLVRTLFFTAFGFVIDWTLVFKEDPVRIALSILVLIFLVRWAWLRHFGSGHIFPETFIAPRGLISVLLFISIPPALKIPSLDLPVVVLVVVASVLVMTAGVWKSSPP